MGGSTPPTVKLLHPTSTKEKAMNTLSAITPGIKPPDRVERAEQTLYNKPEKPLRERSRDAILEEV